MWRGVIEENVKIKGVVNLGKGSVIKSGTYIEGSVWIGENCSVGPNAYLREGTVLCGMNKIGASTEVKNTIFLIPETDYKREIEEAIEKAEKMEKDAAA